jgi:hypothetical protein
MLVVQLEVGTASFGLLGAPVTGTDPGFLCCEVDGAADRGREDD